MISRCPEYTGRRRGFTLIELMVVVAVVAIVASLAIPGFTAARKRANETSAISALKNFITAQSQYRTKNGTFGLLDELVAAGLVDTSFTDHMKSGYVFAELGAITRSFWAFTAEPDDPGITGDRYFYTDSTGVIRYNEGGSAGPTDPSVDG